MTQWPKPELVAINDTELAVYEFATPPMSRGDIILLHGMSDIAFALEPLAQFLVPQYRVIAYDARGHGRSGHPGAYSVLHHVADLASLIEHFGLPHPILIGHSLGGHTVSGYSGIEPTRVRAAVLLEGMGPPSRLVGVDAPEQINRDKAMITMMRATRSHRPQSSIKAAANRLLQVHPRLDPSRALLLAEHGTRSGPDGTRIWRHDQRVFHWVASMNQAEIESRWASITAPVLAASGADAWETWWTRPGSSMAGRQRFTPDEFMERLKLFSDVEHIEVAGAGHMVHFDQPEKVNELVDTFLGRVLV